MSKVALYLMSFKGYKVLENLVNSGKTMLIAHIVYARDKNVKKDYIEEILTLCRTNNITFFEHSEKSLPEQPNYIIAISWRWMIKTTFHSTLIVLHDSLLPKYRGFAPLVSCLINGETTIGVTALLASEEYDKGAIIDQQAITITYPLKIALAIEKITPCYTKLVLNILNNLEKQKDLITTPQQESEATYSLWRDEEDYRINWHNDAIKIKRFIDAVGFPYKGAYTMLEEVKIRIIDVNLLEDVVIENRVSGKLIFYKENKPVFVCGRGLLQITNAVYDKSGENVFPFKKFRIKLK